VTAGVELRSLGELTVLTGARPPMLGGATGWLSSEGHGPTELRRHVVLVNFWTLTCINWLRQEPYVRAGSQAYANDGLVVIGVHTPEFSFEHDVELVRRATEARGIEYAVALDNDYAVWSAFDNHFWPALYVIDADGTIRDHHFGEGRYEQSVRVIQRLLGIERDLVTVEGPSSVVEHLRRLDGRSGRCRGRRRGRQRPAPRKPAVPAGARARHRPRADARDHVPQGRSPGVRMDVRLRRRRTPPEPWLDSRSGTDLGLQVRAVWRGWHRGERTAHQ
jgi:hypothetical protein